MTTGAGVLQAIAAGLPLVALVISFLGGVGGLASVLITERAKAQHQRDIEGVKADHQRDIERLKADLARDTEIARVQLNAIAFERQTRFSRLHERRVEVIADLYRRLVIAERAFNTAMVPLRSGASDEAIQAQQEQDDQAAASAGNAFSQYFQENQVWLDEALCASVQRLARTFYEAWEQYSQPDGQRGRTREKGDAWRRVTNDVPAIRAEIEHAMRIMLGVLDLPD